MIVTFKRGYRGQHTNNLFFAKGTSVDTEYHGFTDAQVSALIEAGVVDTPVEEAPAPAVDLEPTPVDEPPAPAVDPAPTPVEKAPAPAVDPEPMPVEETPAPAETPRPTTKKKATGKAGAKTASKAKTKKG